MATPIDPSQEYPSTYIVEDRSNQEELIRLQVQDRIVTQGMGGVLPEQSDPANFRRVLDVGCGTGGWLIEVAKAFPDIQLLIGIDISGKMIEYARARACEEGVNDRVEFHVMDSLRMLEFPTAYFDLVNQRFSQSYLRTWDWPRLLQEYQRVTRPDGGIIRLTECSSAIESTSQGLTRIWDISVQALHRGGYFFAPTGDSVIKELPKLLKRWQFQDIQTRAVTLDYHAGTPEVQLFAQDMEHLFRTGEPFLRKWINVPDNYKELCQQAVNEMQQPDFLAKWHLLTAWGVRPGDL